MRSLIPLVVLACATAVGATVGACAGTGPSSGGSGAEARPSGDFRPVTGNVHVILRTWDPKNRSDGPKTFALVNATSEAGRRLASGRTPSSEFRVVSDEQMAALLAALDEKGFSAHASQGLSIKELPTDARRRGVIVVERDGASRGLELVATGDLRASPVPTVYRDCKMIVVQIHNAIGGLETGASTSVGDDPSRTFQVPKADLRR